MDIAAVSIFKGAKDAPVSEGRIFAKIIAESEVYYTLGGFSHGRFCFNDGESVSLDCVIAWFRIPLDFFD